ncbi:GntR family transcriptional regulator [Streptomyces stelliscabiei]|uniref:DNA-binding GntR family transcriptional regulator n=1 Tax=Streptomyces stelliscabiei TaxID=146820 RepID=A0A8I0TVJ5_9ACTN|nr:GntR family transcriptional regulator [Streptomyces stelliscabiei]KND40411.1 GntR family transcriptional regulator [Streptomyces stelliscabiei]MBE1601101.1 DNA-binding GntR family transcriptional regulator [Streptomyces stelliscabiei]MDX2517128.1 GntR family transcriptional regulator [Streptomyces stelliscabiei]MDX2554969.1 GntR family transcriptional regulator [Streptomyces stelliscabiei]MDX2611196.1 GntR family transcriptional regulator [Streptomyces stelliscabiei]
MEQAGPRSRQAAPRAPEAAARPASAYRVPAQPGVADVDRERGITADGGGAGVRGDTGGVTDAARGEHTHSETPIPLPRTPERPVLQRSSVRGQILDALRAALAGGELTPGEVYSAPALGERFGVSATPVREAMQQLAIEGAVEVVPNRGFRVVRRGARELAELAEVRALLQVPVVMRLARTVPADRWGELRPLADETARAASTGCRATYGEADRAFHRGVLGLAGNEQLLQIADDLHRRTQLPLGVGHLGDVGSGGRVELMADAAEHIALLDALMAEDLEAACCLVEKHFGAVG